MLTILFYLFVILPLFSCQLELRQVNVISRHGSRSPTKPFPNDPYKDVWPQGYGQLTKIGIRQMFTLGQYLRSYYQHFINGTYINDEVYMRSSSFERSIMSGETLLAGLYPPSGNQVWNEEILWQPIPVHSEDELHDILLNMDDPICPRYDKLHQEAKETDSFQKRNASHEEYYEYLRRMSGLTGPMSPVEVWDIYDDLLNRDINGVPIPSWATEKNMAKMAEFVVWSMDVKFGSLERDRLKGGPLITQLVSNMNQKREGTLDPSRRKLFLYSGHDNNIVTTMKITETYNNLYVPYGAALLVELHQEGDGQYFVMMKLKNDTNIHPYLINITVCEGKTVCPLDQFVEGVSPYFITTEQWLDECSLSYGTLSTAAIITISLVAVLVLILIVGSVIFTRRNCHKTKAKNTYESFSYDGGRVEEQNEKSSLVSNRL